ncbi:MAG TPA: hypothetical protein VF796_23350, partial [Humisphaera sp.]
GLGGRGRGSAAARDGKRGKPMSSNRDTSRRAAVPSPCTIEPLEPREFLSATTVLAGLRPLADWPAHVLHSHAVHADMGPSLVVGGKKPVMADPGPNILGEWVGKYTQNITRAEASGGVTFTIKHNQSFTGTFDTSGIAGKSGVSTVTVVRNRQFLVIVKLPGRTQVSLAGVVTSDGSMITGRYSVEGPRQWTTGVFTFKRP